MAQTNSTRTFTAACHCRRSTLSFTIPTAQLPLPVHFCHCTACRHTHGTLCVMHTGVPKPEMDFSSFTAYKTSEHVTRWFCSTCGAHMIDRAIQTASGGEVGSGTGHKEEKENWYIAISLVDAEESAWDFTIGHFYVAGTRDGGIARFLRRGGGGDDDAVHGKGIKVYENGTGSEFNVPTLPLRPSGSERQENGRETPSQTYKLPFRCHCGGVSIVVSRSTGPESFINVEDSLVPKKDTSKYLALHDVCTSCRLTSSTAIVSWIFVPDSAVGGSFGTAKSYVSSKGVTREFCGVCGATVSYKCQDRQGMMDIAAGLVVVEGEVFGDENQDGARDDEREEKEVVRASGVLAEEWLEWRNGKIAFEKDAAFTGLVAMLKDGLAGSE